MIYFFIHTPKTSGTTFMEVLHSDKKKSVGFFYPPRPEFDNFETRIKDCPAFNMKRYPEWKKFNIIGGHFTFGIHDVLQAASFRYLGVVRKPMEHFISTYRAFLRMNETYRNYLLPGSKQVDDMLSLPFMHNMQTFFLSGLSVEAIKKDKERAFQTVIENSEKYFDGVYLTEKFDEGLFYFKHKVNIRPQCYLSKNIAENTVGETITERVLEGIQKANDIDQRIYEYFEKKFNKEYGELPGINCEVKFFQMRNKIYGLKKYQEKKS